MKCSAISIQTLKFVATLIYRNENWNSDNAKKNVVVTSYLEDCSQMQGFWFSSKKCDAMFPFSAAFFGREGVKSRMTRLQQISP